MKLKIFVLFFLLIAGFYLRLNNFSYFLNERWDNYNVYYDTALKMQNPNNYYDSLISRAPIYHHFLILLTKEFKFSKDGCIKLNIIINLFIGFFVFLILKEINMSGAFIFLSIWILNPRQIHCSNELMIENFYMLIVFLMVNLTSIAIKSGNIFIYIILGFTYSIAFLTRSVIVAFFLPLILYFLLIKNYNIALKLLLSFLVGIVIILLHFYIVSYGFKKEFGIRFENAISFNLYEASKGHISGYLSDKENIEKMDKSELKSKIIENIVNNPYRYIKTSFIRLLYFIYKSFLVFGDGFPFYAVVLIFLFLDKFRLQSSMEDKITMNIYYYFVFYYWIVHMPIFIADRFTYILDPYILFIVCVHYKRIFEIFKKL